MVQVVKEGGENNLHHHTNTDILYMALKGKVRFYGLDHVVYGEFGEREGLLLPADSRYWFKTTGTVPLELFQVFFHMGNVEKAQRINVEDAKPWMAGMPELERREEK